MRRAAAFLGLWLALTAAAPTGERLVPGSDARWIMERSNLAFYYAGEDVKGSMVVELHSGAAVRGLRVMTMLRRSAAPGGEQKYLLYFHQPGDVRRMSCMTWKHVARDDERWMFVPALGTIVKVRAPERSSFLGSDLTREEFSGRDVDADRHRLVGQETRDGRACYVVESVPRDTADFVLARSWIDRETFLPLRQEFRSARDGSRRVIAASRIVSLPSRAHPGRRYPTVLERTITRTGDDRWTRVTLDSLEYDIGIRDADFTQEHLRVPLESWFPPRPGRALGATSSASAPAPGRGPG